MATQANIIRRLHAISVGCTSVVANSVATRVSETVWEIDTIGRGPYRSAEDAAKEIRIAS